MKSSLLIILISTIFLTGLCSTTTHPPAEIGPWVKLGAKKVAYGVDRDVINVGRHDGVFTKLKIEIKGGGLNMRRMVVQYANGAKDEIAIRHNFSRGSASRIIDLKGGGRQIRDVTFWYDTDNKSRRRATVHLWGRR